MTTGSTLRRTLLSLLVAAGMLAACSDDKSTTSTTASTAAPAVSTPAASADSTVTSTTESAAPSTDAPSSSTADSTADSTATSISDAPIAGTWTKHDAAKPCECSDGSPFSYWVHKANPAKVMLFFQGGGACFSAETCDPAQGRYKKAIGPDEDPSKLSEGIFDLSNPDNPLADYSLVFVPYCTGDVHIGDSDHDYGNGLTIHHRGFVNGSAALDTLVAEFPNAEHLVVAGESAGSVATPLFAGLATDRLPKASITVLADGSGAYPDVPAVNATIGAIWGTANVIPDWPVNKGMVPADYSIPGLFVQSGKHAPRIIFGRYDYAFDQTQEFFASIAGFGADQLVQMIDQNEAQIEGKGVTIHSYTASGDEHTILHTNEFYKQTVNGTKLVDWVAALIDGKPEADVHCTACTK